MGKGKGRQSGNFDSKSQRAAFAQEIQQQSRQVKLSRPRPQQPSRKSSSERPRFTRLTQLRGILRERQTLDARALIERRRRAGFLPARESKVPEAKPIVSHPPGWLLELDKRNIPQTDDSVGSLQSKCLEVLCLYVIEYLEAMGKENLHLALSLLPSETIEDLSVAISKKIGITNELAVVLGKHTHVEALSFRASCTESKLNDEGLMELIPTLPFRGVRDSWEDLDGTDEALVDVMKLEGCNVRLKRLELLGCQSISANVLIQLFEKCACITHLSLAGSLNGAEEGGRVLLMIPDLLPALQVLDITNCAWMTTSLLNSFLQCYNTQKTPVVYCDGCFMDAYQGHGHDW